MAGNGLAPYGIRHSGLAPKGKGYFGLLKRPGGGFSTELSRESEINGKNVEYPLIVPGLSREQLDNMLSGGTPDAATEQIARQHAISRMNAGQSPFAGPTELRMPMPLAQKLSNPYMGHDASFWTDEAIAKRRQMDMQRKQRIMEQMQWERSMQPAAGPANPMDALGQRLRMLFGGQ